MAAVKKKSQKAGKAKKKMWFNLVAPAGFNSVELGETTVFEPENLKGRHVRINLMNLTNDPRSQHVNITFRIDKISGTTAQTEVIGYDIIPSHMKRLVRRNRDRVDHSFLAKSKDEKVLKVKFMIITRNKANNSTTSSLRKAATAELSSAIAKSTSEDMFKDVIFAKVQKGIKQKLAKITPLRNVEIKSLKIDENRKRKDIVIPPKEEPKPETPPQQETDISDLKETKPAPVKADEKTEPSASTSKPVEEKASS